MPNGELTAAQLRFLGSTIKPYGADGCADITTRANIQLRGIQIEHADTIISGLRQHGLTSFQTGMDNVRNLTGNPLAGVDPHELIDSRPLLRAIDAMITNDGAGNAELTNLPRKINISMSTTRDDFPHSHINDLAFEAVQDGQGQVVFNVQVRWCVSASACCSVGRPRTARPRDFAG